MLRGGKLGQVRGIPPDGVRWGKMDFNSPVRVKTTTESNCKPSSGREKGRIRGKRNDQSTMGGTGHVLGSLLLELPVSPLVVGRFLAVAYFNDRRGRLSAGRRGYT